MPAPITDKPKLTPRGTAAIGVEVTPSLRESLVSISKRRGETLRQTVAKALAQYVAADARR